MAKFRLQPLLEYARDRSESAAQELQRLRHQWSMAEEKLQQLRAYLADYHQKLNDNAAGGMTAAALRDFQRFIVKLELAIQVQGEEVFRCRQRWEVGQQEWLEREREVKVYDALRERHEREELRKESKRDQRAQDEFAQNQHRRLNSEDPQQK